MWRDFLINGRSIIESDFKIDFPRSSFMAFIKFDLLKSRFSSFYGINNTPTSSDFVGFGLTQNRCYIIEAKNFGKIQDLSNKETLERLERNLSKKLVDTLLILAGVLEGKEKRLLFQTLWDKGVVYYLLVGEEKTKSIIKVIEYLERKITQNLKVCGYKKIKVYFITLDKLQKKLNKLENMEGITMSSKTVKNLDKICAEYGMELLSSFCELNTERLNNTINLVEFENIVNEFQDPKETDNFDKSKKEEYINKLKNKIENKISEILNSPLLDIEKYLIVTWVIYPFKKKLLGFDFNKISALSKERERIQKLIKAVKLQFVFSSSQFETEITKALGVLVEDGPFAYMIWLKSQDKEPHRAMLIQTARILQKLNLIRKIKHDDDLREKIEDAFLNEISSDLTKTLFTKTILEKMLIYGRYKAKAMQNEAGGK